MDSSDCSFRTRSHHPCDCLRSDSHCFRPYPFRYLLQRHRRCSTQATVQHCSAASVAKSCSTYPPNLDCPFLRTKKFHFRLDDSEGRAAVADDLPHLTWNFPSRRNSSNPKDSPNVTRYFPCPHWNRCCSRRPPRTEEPRDSSPKRSSHFLNSLQFPHHSPSFAAELRSSTVEPSVHHHY